MRDKGWSGGFSARCGRIGAARRKPERHHGGMTFTPDTKDWTWVLQRRCPQCGFDASTFPADEVPARVRADLPAWAARLSQPDARTRPDDSTWSPLEYAAHVRDVFRLF